jgi:myo-inositol-1(or 4)-monophosphatase
MLPSELAHGTLHLARSIVVEVGTQLLTMSHTLRATTDKGGVDVVTAADRLSESAITTALAKHFPTHRIAGEEGTRLGPANSPWTWHLDPLDGTANYSRGIPYWSISLGLSFEHTPVLGIVHGPACGISVNGIANLGAWMGETPLPRATAAAEKKSWIIATDWPWDLEERQRTNQLLSNIAPHIRQYKTFGSAALDLSAIAMGVIDAYLISKIFPWDQCAGAAICAGLGYELRCWNGQPWDLAHHDIVACRPGMWHELAAYIPQ